jgi:hypothetical protein
MMARRTHGNAAQNRGAYRTAAHWTATKLDGHRNHDAWSVLGVPRTRMDRQRTEPRNRTGPPCRLPTGQPLRETPL